MKTFKVVAPLALAMAAVGCAGSADPVSPLDGPSFGIIAPPAGPPAAEQIVVCKVGGSGTYDFTYSGGASGGFSLQPGQCWDLGFFGGAGVSLTITEVPVPGHEVVSITVDQSNSADQSVTGTNTVSGVLGSGNPANGALVTFTNRVIPDEPQGSEGCTPGYWKNHTDSWVGYAPGATAGSVFALGGFPTLASRTLLQTLDGAGGPGALGAARILLRAATAALLNAASPGVDYTLTSADIVTQVNAALASNERGTMLALAASLDRDNNLGCPLN
jgi:hypothetical protein